MFSRIVVNHGIKVHYKVRRGSGRTLVFLHGGGGSMSVWDLILPYFSDKYHLITVDLRGHGLSDKPRNTEDYQLEQHAEDIHQILRKEHIKQAIIIGHCFGSMVGVTYTAMHRSKVEKFILINTGDGLPWILGSRVTYPLIWLLLTSLSIVCQEVNPKKRVDYTQFQQTSELSINRLWADMKVMGVQTALKQIQAMKRWNGKRYFQKIRCPTFLVVGLYDVLFSKKYSLNLAKIMRGEIVFIKSNHLAIVNQPKDVYDTIKSFLRS